MEWIDIEQEKPDPEQIVFLLGKDHSICMRGTRHRPYFLQIMPGIDGEVKLIMNFEFTHWMPFPKIPK